MTRNIQILFSELANFARERSLPIPVIELHPSIAQRLADMLAAEIGDPAFFGNRGCAMHTAGRPVWLFGSFDGVSIIAPRAKTCKHEVDGWREHFGPLADIWSDA